MSKTAKQSGKRPKARGAAARVGSPVPPAAAKALSPDPDVRPFQISEQEEEQAQRLFKDLARSWRQFLSDQYQRTRNPLFLWRAYLNLPSGEPIPDWMLAYFGRVARGLLRLSKSAADGKAKDAAQRFGEVFMEKQRKGRGGVGLVFEQFKNEIRNYDLARELKELIAEGHQLDHALDRVVKDRQRIDDETVGSPRRRRRKEIVGRTTVANAYKKYRHFLEEKPLLP